MEGEYYMQKKLMENKSKVSKFLIATAATYAFNKWLTKNNQKADEKKRKK